jgi:hypothetical protein
MDSALIDGKEVLEDIKAVIDTGTAAIIGDTGSVAKFYEAIPNSKLANETDPSLLGFYTCNFIFHIQSYAY